jgi:curved DNA-binding protein
MASPDYYELLGVPPGADREEIRRAYHRLARRYHPDVSTDPAAEQRFHAITTAYEVLSDPARRARYDRERAPRPRARTRRDPFPSPGLVDIGDLLDRSRGGRRVRVDRRPVAGSGRGADLEAEIEISVADAYLGGRGEVTIATAAGPRRCEVSIPPGAVDGQRIRLAGRGAAGPGGGRPGDLRLVVRIAPHPRYRLEGRDLIVALPLSPWEAVLGARVTVDTPAGQREVEVPAGSSTGRRLPLPEPRMSAEIDVVVPARPTAAERALFERLAALSRFNPRGT